MRMYQEWKYLFHSSGLQFQELISFTSVFEKWFEVVEGEYYHTLINVTITMARDTYYYKTQHRKAKNFKDTM